MTDLIPALRDFAKALNGFADALEGQQQGQNPVSEFISKHCHHAPGELMLFGEFYDRYQESGGNLSKRQVVDLLPPKYPFGRYTNNRRFVGNLSWEPGEMSRRPVTLNGDWLKVPRGRTQTCYKISRDADILQIMRCMRSEGATFDAIADWLNGAGYRTPRDCKFYPTTVRNWLLSASDSPSDTKC